MAARFLVVGAGGQVGGALLRHLDERGVGTWRRPPAGGHALDLEEVAAQPDLAAAAVDGAGADVVCIAAGMTHVDGCESEPDRAARINRDGPAALARAARASGASTVHFSTEYVFDGEAGPYGEDDEPRPLSVYGQTKLEGERAVLAADPGALVIRTTVVYGPESHGRNTAYQLAARLRAHEPVNVPFDQVTTPTYNPDLAGATVALVEAGVGGVVHVAGPELLPRSELARRLAAAMGLEVGLVRPVATADLVQPARRPLLAGLRTDRTRRLLPSFTTHTVEDAITHWAEGGFGTLPWCGP